MLTIANPLWLSWEDQYLQFSHRLHSICENVSLLPASSFQVIFNAEFANGWGSSKYSHVSLFKTLFKYWYCNLQFSMCIPAEGRLLNSAINTNNLFNWIKCNLKNLPSKKCEIGNNISRGLLHQEAIRKISSYDLCGY